MEEITKETKICIETNKNENITTQNLWDSVKSVLRGKFLAIQAYLKKQVKNQINSLTVHLKQLEKEEMRTSGLIEGKKSYIKKKRRLYQKSTKLKSSSLRR